MMAEAQHESKSKFRENNKNTNTESVLLKSQLRHHGFDSKLCMHNEHLFGDTYNNSYDLNSEPNVEEQVEWLINTNWDDKSTHSLNLSQLCLCKGPLKLNIDDETNFCSPEILRGILNAKGIFDELNPSDLSLARCRANPFETIKSAFFMNRAALKMANIDAVTDFMFTNIDRNPHHVNTNNPYYFADVCAGPGGFSEYILWRKKWLFKGFGFTLKGNNDFKLSDSNCASPVTFNSLYGSIGDGNIFCPENIEDFKLKVLHETEGLGVHFMMSDGGFSVEGNENIQEILSKQIYLCQCFTALEIVRPNGHFVTKVFDLFTPFSVGLIFLMYKCFEKVTIVKPNASRPANSERYFVCYGLKQSPSICLIKEYLRKAVFEFWSLHQNQDMNLDITSIVPIDIIKEDANFYNYIINSNNKLGLKQTCGLVRLAKFCRNPSLNEPRQEELRQKCLSYWRIPDKPRILHSYFSVNDLIMQLENPEFMLVQPEEVNSTEDLERVIGDYENWSYALMFCNRKFNVGNIYAGVGNSQVFRLQGNKWVKQKRIRLVKGTLLYGELVKEEVVRSDQKIWGPIYRYSLHVIDALRLGDLSLADLSFEERSNLVQTYCKAVNHEFNEEYVRIRIKETKSLPSLPADCDLNYFYESKQYSMKLPVLGYKNIKESFPVHSLLFIKTDKVQSFHSTFVLRAQVMLQNENEFANNGGLQLSQIKQYVKTKTV